MSEDIDIITHGCRLNASESRMIKSLAEQASVRDAVIVNTCAVTNSAIRTARRHIRRARAQRPGARIIVTGCAAQINPQGFAAMPEVDLVLGNAEKLSAQSWTSINCEETARLRVNDIMDVRETAGHMIDGYGERARAFLQIQNGCDHRCTFCIIPFARGPSRSVPAHSVIAGARALVEAGHKEIVLTGVDITAYGKDLDGESDCLGRLVARILDEIPQLFRLRLSSIDGAEIDDELFERLTGDERIAPHAHLSLQAGDNLILKRMKRRHTREDAITLCEKIRALRPEFAFGADIIAGFPTETEEMFSQSLNLVDDAGLQYLHVFPFSPHDGAPAARMPQVPATLIKERAARLRAKGQKALHNFLDSLAGETFDCVVESGGRARLGNFAIANISSPHVGSRALVRLNITRRSGEALIGEIVNDDAAPQCAHAQQT